MLRVTSAARFPIVVDRSPTQSRIKISVKLIAPLDGVNVLVSSVSDGLDISRTLQSTGRTCTRNMLIFVKPRHGESKRANDVHAERCYA